MRHTFIAFILQRQSLGINEFKLLAKVFAFEGNKLDNGLLPVSFLDKKIGSFGKLILALLPCCGRETLRELSVKSGLMSSVLFDIGVVGGFLGFAFEAAKLLRGVGSAIGILIIFFRVKSFATGTISGGSEVRMATSAFEASDAVKIMLTALILALAALLLRDFAASDLCSGPTLICLCFVLLVLGKEPAGSFLTGTESCGIKTLLNCSILTGDDTVTLSD
jgi:hypothetical protein